MAIYLLSDNIDFPPPHLARKDGLLALGGDLSQERLLLAYKEGIFPWYSSGEPILWWSPDPRLVLYPEKVRISRSLKKTIKKDLFRVTMDKAFARVIDACARTRLEQGQPTWIMPEMVTAFCNLHESGHAHSVEAWRGKELVGGLYGLAMGRCFSGESMFTRVSNASKVAFAYLVHHLRRERFQMVDCQVSTPHLKTLGAEEISRNSFLRQLKTALRCPDKTGRWQVDIEAVREDILTSGEQDH